MSLSHRKPIWQPGTFARLFTTMKDALTRVSFGRLTLASFGLLVLLYLYGEITHNAVVIDPFAVPKRFEEIGLTPSDSRTAAPVARQAVGRHS